MMPVLHLWPANTPEELSAFYGRLDLDQSGQPRDAWRNTFLTEIIAPYKIAATVCA